MKCVLYILYSDRYDKYYIGHTNTLKRRLEEHNDPEKRGWTNSYKPWSLVYSEDFKTRSEAMYQEKYLKSLKSKTKVKEYIAGWRSSTSGGS